MNSDIQLVMIKAIGEVMVSHVQYRWTVRGFPVVPWRVLCFSRTRSGGTLNIETSGGLAQVNLNDCWQRTVCTADAVLGTAEVNLRFSERIYSQVTELELFHRGIDVGQVLPVCPRGGEVRMTLCDASHVDYLGLLSLRLTGAAANE